MLTDHLVDHLLDGASFAGVPRVVSSAQTLKEKRFAMENFPEMGLFGSLVHVVAVAVVMAMTMMMVTATTLLDDNNLVGSICGSNDHA